MKRFTGWQWLLIDAANQYGHDKLQFEARIEWTNAMIANGMLEAMASDAETKPLYIKAVSAIRKAQQGIATGHLVGVDATCSGIQMMSALTGCVAGARATGMVDPDRRADAYGDCTFEMNKILGGGFSVPRADAKQGLMTTMYGSKKEPEKIFGQKTPELAAFYLAAQTIAPGAWGLLQDLINSWEPFALSHSWKLPDGFDAVVRVRVDKEVRIEVDELEGASFTYAFSVNEGKERGVSNAANVVHSVDAWVLRSMHRRCNYDREMVEQAKMLIDDELGLRAVNPCRSIIAYGPTGKVKYYVEQYNRSSVADVVILPYLDAESISQLTDEHLEAMSKIINGMLQYRPFPITTNHDEFKSHPNNVDWVRWQYREIMAELAESNLLEDLLSQLYKEPCTFSKLSFNLPDLIRGSNYALC